MSTLRTHFHSLAEEKHVFTGLEHPRRVSCHLSWIFQHEVEHFPHCIRRRLSYRPTKAFFSPSSGRSLARQRYYPSWKEKNRTKEKCLTQKCWAACLYVLVLGWFSASAFSACFLVCWAESERHSVRIWNFPWWCALSSARKQRATRTTERTRTVRDYTYKKKVIQKKNTAQKKNLHNIPNSPAASSRSLLCMNADRSGVSYSIYFDAIILFNF